MKRIEAGFTLLEVVVAIAVIGAGFAAGLAAMSGSLRLMRIAGEYEQAMYLARSAMAEALTYPDTDIVADREREFYEGVDYGYRVEFRPVRLLSADEARIAPSPVALQQVSVDVSWGPDPGRSYRLVTYRLVPASAAVAQERARGTAPAPEQGPAAKDGSGSGGAEAPADRPAP